MIIEPLTEQEQKNLLKDMYGLVHSLLNESERATVILAAARLDTDLEALLKHVLIPAPGGVDPIFEGDRMLGTFSAKITMAHRLGLIDADFEHTLQILRKIRNDFAHQMDSECLSAQKQKARLAIIVRWAKEDSVFQTGVKAFAPKGKSFEQIQFVACVSCMALILQTGLRTLRRVHVGTPLSVK